MSYINMKEEPAGTSKFYMIRCVIAMAHADGEVCDEERAYINALMRHINFSDEQRQTLRDDLDNEQDVADLFRYINDPRFRGQTVYFARILAHKDGVLDPSEQDLLDRIHAMATDGLDLEQIRADAHKAAQVNLKDHDLTLDRIAPQGGLFGVFDEMMLSLGYDLTKD